MLHRHLQSTGGPAASHEPHQLLTVTTTHPAAGGTVAAKGSRIVSFSLDCLRYVLTEADKLDAMMRSEIDSKIDSLILTAQDPTCYYVLIK